MTRERPRLAEPKGKAKTLRQKDRIRTGLRKVHAKEDAHQRGNRCKTGNLSGSGASSIRRFHFFRGRIVSGNAAPAGNTLCISKGDNAAWRNCSRQRRNGFMEETPKTEAERPKGPFCLFFCAKTGASRRKGASNPYRPSATSPRGGSKSEASHISSKLKSQNSKR